MSHDIEGSLTEGVFIDTIQDNENYYHRLEWLHVLESRRDLRDEELAQLEDNDLDAPVQFPCVKVVNMAFRSSTQDSLGSPDELSIRPEWDEIQPVAYLSGLEKLPGGLLCYAHCEQRRSRQRVGRGYVRACPRPDH